MNVEGLFNHLATYQPLSDNFRDAVKKELISLSPPKFHILLEAPHISKHAYFLNTGFAMSYSHVNGKKVTEELWKAGQIIVAFRSFFEQIPTTESIQLMLKSDVLCISYESVMNLLDVYPEAQRIYRAVMNEHYIRVRERLHDIQRNSASYRLEKLIHTFPNVEQIVPQEAIASYLGITAQSLARLKRQKR